MADKPFFDLTAYDPWIKEDQVEFWEEAWQANCTSGYGLAINIFAFQWMLTMQQEIHDKGKAVADVAAVAEKKVLDADPFGGLTGFQYGCAVNLLAQCWKHGDELREWHNLATQIGTEGEEANRRGATLNPALLVVKDKS